MSRSSIPGGKNKSFVKGWRQVCLYSFPKDVLEVYSSSNSKSILEEIEDIEILRFIELGYAVQMIEMSDDSIPVDNFIDIKKVEKAIYERNL